MAEANNNQDWLSKYERVNPDAPPKNEDWLSKYEKVSSPSEMQALRQGVIGGAAEFAPAVPVTMATTKAGAALGSPLGPPGVAVGGTLGFVTGLFLSSEMGEAARNYLASFEDPFSETGTLTTRTLEEIPKDVRSYGAFGETFGSAVTGGLTFAGVAKTGIKTSGTTKVGKLFNELLSTAKNKTKKFLAAETSAAFGSAMLGGFSEEIYPGDPIARFVAESVGGFVNVPRIVMGSWDVGSGVINKALQATTESGRQSAASKFLAETLEEFGEDPVVLAQLLREDPSVKGLLGTQSSAQKTGSEALAAIQSALARRNPAFNKEVIENANAVNEVLNNAIVILRNEGDPESLRAAAALTAHSMNSAMQLQVKSAMAQAQQAVSDMVGAGIRNRSEISKAAQKVLKNSLDDIKVEEDKLWSLVPKDTPVSGNSIAAEISNIVDNLLIPGDKLPPQVTAFAENHQKLVKTMFKGEPISEELANQFTSQKIQAFRSRMLELARDTAKGANPNSLNVKIFNRLANAALEDMDQALPSNEAYALARGFTKAKAEAFNKTFAAEALRKEGSGADSIDPEVLLAQTFAGGVEATALKSSELVEASGFLARQELVDLDNVEDYSSQMMDLQEEYLRTFTLEAKSDDGFINRNSLKQVLKNNSEFLQRFPDVSTAIRNALKSDKALTELTERIAGKTKIIENKTAFANLLTEGIAGARLAGGSAIGVIENPAKAVERVVKSPEPKREIARLIGLAKRSKQTMQGLQASVIDYAMQESGGDLEKIRSALFDPVDSQTPSLIKMMQQYNVVDADYVGRLNKIFNEASKASRAEIGPDVIGEIGGATSAIADLVTRGVGSIGATTGSKALGAPESSLIIAGAGSRASQKMFDKIPGQKIAEIIQDAAQNPELMALLLEKAPDPKRQLEKTRQLHAYLLQAGYFELTDALTDDEQNQ